MPTRTCIACGRPFEGHFNARTCSPECRRARRRGLDAGVTALPPPTRACKACGTAFPARVGRKTCSTACADEARRAKWRAYWQAHPEKKRKAVAARRERRKSDPEWAREQDRRKWARQSADPDTHEQLRARARAHYARHREEIQARRKAKAAAMTPEELAERLKRSRAYCREWRQRLRQDPEGAARDEEYQRTYKRRRRLESVQAQAASLEAEVGARLSGERSVPARPCAVCGGPVIGRRPNARTCSDECQRRRRLEYQRAYRAAQPPKEDV